MNRNIVCLGPLPLSISKIQLKYLLKAICHIDVKLGAIDEHIKHGKVKVVFLEYGDAVIETIAIDRLRRFGEEILTNVIVKRPMFLSRSKYFCFPPHLLKKYSLPPHNTLPFEVAYKAMQWLHYELHLKYPQLHIIDIKHNHAVYEGLMQTIFQRLVHMMSLNESRLRQTIDLYRKLYPHFADIELVLSHIAAAQKKRGLQPTDYTEADLLIPTPPPVKEAKKKELWEQHSKVLKDKVQSYIANLDTETSADDSSEMVLRKKIRLTMKHFSQHLPQMVTYKPRKDLYGTKDWMLLYFLGEPTQCSVKVLKLYLEKHGVQYFDVVRSREVLSATRVYIPMDQYDKVMKLNGCNPRFEGLKLSTTTDIIYIRHTNDRYSRKNYLVQAEKIFKQWNMNTPE